MNKRNLLMRLASYLEAQVDGTEPDEDPADLLEAVEEAQEDLDQEEDGDEAEIPEG